MRDRCPYCGLPNVAREYADSFSGKLYRDIRQHACYRWAAAPALSTFDSDTSFISEARNSQDGLKAWREQNR